MFSMKKASAVTTIVLLFSTLLSFIASFPVPASAENGGDKREILANFSSKVYFDVSKSVILPEYERALKTTVSILRVYPDNKVVIEGHADNSGERLINKKLSYERAVAVRDFFVSEGVDAKRIEVTAYGDTEPAAENDSEEGRRLNRRAEIIVLK